MTGTPSRTARVSVVRRNLKEAAGKLPARGTRTAYEASRRAFARAVRPFHPRGKRRMATGFDIWFRDVVGRARLLWLWFRSGKVACEAGATAVAAWNCRAFSWGLCRLVGRLNCRTSEGVLISLGVVKRPGRSRRFSHRSLRQRVQGFQRCRIFRRPGRCRFLRRPLDPSLPWGCF